MAPDLECTPRPEADIAACLSVALQPSSNGRHLVHHVAPKAPFFFLGDTAWETLHRLDDKEAEFLLRNRAAKGFNAVMMVIMAEHGRDGHWPFHPLPISSKTYSPDFTRPNPAYFAFLDRLLILSAKLGITLPLVPTWGRYINGGYYGSPILFDESTAHHFGRFLGKRYPFQPWILGGDSNRYWNPRTAAALRGGEDVKGLEVIDYGPVSEAMARGLIEGEGEAIEALSGELKTAAEGYKTFITFHSAQIWLPGTSATSSSAQFPSAPWLTLDVIQTGHHDGVAPSSSDSSSSPDIGANGTTNEPRERTTPPPGTAQGGAVTQGIGLWRARSSYIPIRQMYDARASDGRPRPVMDLEPHYENTNYWFQPDQPMWVGRDIRSGGWQAIFAGACGYTYGVNSIWQAHNSTSTTHPPIAPPTNAATDWYLELDLPGSYYASIMQKVMLSLPDFFNRIPDNEFILSDRFEPADGTPAGDKLIQGMRGKGWGMVHLPYGGEVEVDVKGMLAGTSGVELVSSSKRNGVHGVNGHANGNGHGHAGDEKKVEWRAWWIDPKTGGRQTFDSGSEKGIKSFKSPTGGSLDEDWILYVETGSAGTCWFDHP